MTFSLPNKTRRLWQLRIAVVFVLFFIAVFLIFKFSFLSLVINLILLVFKFILLLIYIPLYFKNYKISVYKSSISVSKGVFLKTVYIMPFPRLVFAQSFETPLSAMLNLRGVLLKAARSWLLIPELKRIDAEYLLDNLKVRKNV